MGSGRKGVRVRAARKCILEVPGKNKFHVSLSWECFVFLLQFGMWTRSGRGNVMEGGVSEMGVQL